VKLLGGAKRVRESRNAGREHPERVEPANPTKLGKVIVTLNRSRGGRRALYRGGFSVVNGNRKELFTRVDGTLPSLELQGG